MIYNTAFGDNAHLTDFFFGYLAAAAQNVNKHIKVVIAHERNRVKVCESASSSILKLKSKKKTGKIVFFDKIKFALTRQKAGLRDV